MKVIYLLQYLQQTTHMYDTLQYLQSYTMYHERHIILRMSDIK